MPDITIIPANLATVALESFLYGTLVVLFVSTLYFLANRRTLAGDKQSVKHHFLSLPFLGVTVLFLLATAHWSIVLYQAYFAFIHLGTSALEDAFYADLANPSELMKSGFYLTAVILGDSLVVYRLWVIWARNRRIVLFPICAMVGTAVLAVGLLHVQAKWKPALRGAPFHLIQDPWMIPGYVLSFSTNIYSTGFIIYRICNVSKTARPAAGRSLMRFLSILAESAALQTLWFTLVTLVILLKSDAEFIFVDCFPAILGISNMLIHARVGLGWSQYSVDPPKAPALRHANNNALPLEKETV